MTRSLLRKITYDRQYIVIRDDHSIEFSYFNVLDCFTKKHIGSCLFYSIYFLSSFLLIYVRITKNLIAVNNMFFLLINT